MELPLTSRELVRQTRRRGIFIARTIVPGAVTIALALLLLFGIHVRPETVGAICYFLALMFQYGVVFLAAPLMTADLIAREKEERTLPLLLVANARSLDVVGSKYLSVLLVCELLILSTLPLIAFAGFFGGVDVGAGAMQTLLNMAAAAAFAALGMLASSLTHQPRVALWIAYLLIAVYLGLEWSGRMLGFAYTSFLHIIVTSGGDASLQRAWPAFGSLGAVLIAALLAAAWLVAHESWNRPWRFDWRARRRTAPRKHCDSADALRVLVARLGPVRGAGHRTLSAVLLVAITVVCYLVGQVTIPLLIAAVSYQTASSVRELVRSGSLDDLRLLPVDRWQLGEAVFRKHFVSALFLLPALALAGGNVGGTSSYALVTGIKTVVAAVLGYAVLRYIAAHAAQRATTTHLAILPLFALGRVLIFMMISTLLASVLFVLVLLPMVWFSIRSLPASGTILGIFWMASWLIAVFALFTFMGGDRDPRLQFARQLEKDLSPRM
jgi:hypothetical protein